MSTEANSLPSATDFSIADTPRSKQKGAFMSLLLSQIAGIAALVPALQFGQLPNVLDVSGATKDAFQATSSALDDIGTKDPKAKSSGAKQGTAAAKQTKSPATMFSKMGERANSANATGPSQARLTTEEQEKTALRFLGSSTDLFFRGMLSLVGVAFAWCIGVRIKEKVRDYTTGRPSLAKSRIVRR